MLAKYKQMRVYLSCPSLTKLTKSTSCANSTNVYFLTSRGNVLSHGFNVDFFHNDLG